MQTSLGCARRSSCEALGCAPFRSPWSAAATVGSTVPAWLEPVYSAPSPARIGLSPSVSKKYCPPETAPASALRTYQGPLQCATDIVLVLLLNPYQHEVDVACCPDALRQPPRRGRQRVRMPHATLAMGGGPKARRRSPKHQDAIRNLPDVASRLNARSMVHEIIDLQLPWLIHVKEETASATIRIATSDMTEMTIAWKSRQAASHCRWANRCQMRAWLQTLDRRVPAFECRRSLLDEADVRVHPPHATPRQLAHPPQPPPIPPSFPLRLAGPHRKLRPNANLVQRRLSAP
jgi:hypothetical protein